MHHDLLQNLALHINALLLEMMYHMSPKELSQLNVFQISITEAK